MKKIIFIILCIIPFVTSIAYPKLTSYITDQANIISQEDEKSITGLIKQIEQETTVEIAIVTIKSLEGIPKEQYALELFEQSGIGKKDKDNGLLMLIALQEREYRVEVGYGLEGLIPDSSKVTLGTRILEPYFKKGEFGKGIYESLLVIQKILQGQEEVLSQYKSNSYNTKQNYLTWVYILFFIIIISSIFIRKRNYILYPIILPKPKWNNRSGGFGSSGFGSRSSFGHFGGGFGGGVSGGGGFGGRF